MLRLRETLSFVSRSRHYAERFRDTEISSETPLKTLQTLPFTYPAELRTEPLAFLCVPLSEAERIVTLPTSGTTGTPKRVYFSAAELGATEHFFRFGMRSIARHGGRTMVFMRGGAPDGFAVPGGVCDLLSQAQSSIGCTSIAYGELGDDAQVEAASVALRTSNADCVVGTAAQMQRLAHLGPQPSVRSVLLSADDTPREVLAELAKAWRCRVFRHYGMTETAFGGAVDCRPVFDGSDEADCVEGECGMHIREPDMIFEVVDPATGEQMPDGEPGELVLTTLTRRVMPLVRYRTGDISRIIPGKCPCGCVLRRLDYVTGHA